MSFWGNIKAGLGFGTVVRAESAAIAQLPLSQQYQRIGGSLTPAQVSSILYQADAGDPSRLVDLANDSRQKDGHLHSCLFARENSLSVLPLQFDPFVLRGEREASEASSEVAGFVEDCTASAVGDGEGLRDISDTIAHLQGGVLHGYSHSEIAWAKTGLDIIPIGFAPIDQRRFRFRERDGKLVQSDCWGENGVDLRHEYPGQFLQHTPRINGDVLPREGLSRLLSWAALFRNWAVADWMKLAELAWKPWRMGFYSSKSGKDDRANLLKALRYLTSNGVGIFRDDHNIDIKWPESSGSGSGSGNHKSLCDFMGGEMSKAIIGQTLTTEAGERGARSLGEVHDRVRKDIREVDAKAIAATLRRDYVLPLVRMNFGPNAPIPLVKFGTDDAVDLAEYASGISSLKTAGLRIRSADVYDKAGLTKPINDDEVLGDSVDVDMSEFDEDDNGSPDEPTTEEPEETNDGD